MTNSVDLFIGTWRLMEFFAINAKNQNDIVLPFSKRVSGVLIYTAQGYMSANLGSAERVNFKNSDYRMGEMTEIFSAFNSMISYSGTYSLQPNKSIISHKVIQSHFPNWIGMTVHRNYEFQDNFRILKLSANHILIDNKQYLPILTWQKI